MIFLLSNKTHRDEEKLCQVIGAPLALLTTDLPITPLTNIRVISFEGMNIIYSLKTDTVKVRSK